MKVENRTFERWLDHPLVKEAERGLDDEYSPLDLLASLHDVLSTLDERFPGIPYQTILECKSFDTSDRSRIARTMRAAGVSLADVELVTGLPQTESTYSNRNEMFELVRLGNKPRHFEALGYSKSMSKLLSRLRRPITELEARVIEKLKQGMSDKEIRMVTGVSLRSVTDTRLKWEYRKWLERRSEGLVA